MTNNDQKEVPDKHAHRQIQVRIPEEVVRGRYANTMFVNNTQEEFMLDFGTFLPQQNQILVSDRIYLSPAHTKRVIEALQRQMAAYEKSHGTVTAGIDIAEQTKEIGYTVG